MDPVNISQLDIATRMLAYDLNRIKAVSLGLYESENRELAQKMVALSVAIKIQEPVIGRYIDYFA
jgi:hypothetical protein